MGFEDGFLVGFGTPTALDIQPDILSDGTFGVAYSEQLTVVTYSGTLSWHMDGTLPPGLTFNSSTGLFGGTPTSVGTFRPITISVIDSAGATGLRDYTITVQGDVLIVIDPPDGTFLRTVGASVSISFTATETA